MYYELVNARRAETTTPTRERSNSIIPFETQAKFQKTIQCVWQGDLRTSAVEADGGCKFVAVKDRVGLGPLASEHSAVWRSFLAYFVHWLAPVVQQLRPSVRVKIRSEEL